MKKKITKNLFEKKRLKKFIIVYRSFLFQNKKNFLKDQFKSFEYNLQKKNNLKISPPIIKKKFCFFCFFSLLKVPHIILFRKKSKKNFLIVPGGTLKPKEKKNSAFDRLIKLNFGNIIDDNKKITFKSNKWFFPEEKINLKYPFPISQVKLKKNTLVPFFLNLPQFTNLKIKKNREMIAISCFEIYQNFSKYGLILSSNITSFSN